MRVDAAAVRVEAAAVRVEAAAVRAEAPAVPPSAPQCGRSAGSADGSAAAVLFWQPQCGRSAAAVRKRKAQCGRSAEGGNAVRTHPDRSAEVAPAVRRRRGPQAQAMSQVIIDRVNANFGYQAISRISLVQTLVDQPASPPPAPAPTTEPQDIWTLDDKLKDVKSPELRAALRRLGSPVGSPVSHDDDSADNPSGDTTRTASKQPPSD